MVTIRNKFILLAAGFWLTGILLILLGAFGRNAGWQITQLLFTTGIIAQAIGFGFLAYAIMQGVFSRKK